MIELLRDLLKVMLIWGDIQDVEKDLWITQIGIVITIIPEDMQVKLVLNYMEYLIGRRSLNIKIKNDGRRNIGMFCILL